MNVILRELFTRQSYVSAAFLWCSLDTCCAAAAFAASLLPSTTASLTSLGSGSLLSPSRLRRNLSFESFLACFGGVWRLGGSGELEVMRSEGAQVC